jgi:hypothetical protein
MRPEEVPPYAGSAARTLLIFGDADDRLAGRALRGREGIGGFT